MIRRTRCLWAGPAVLLCALLAAPPAAEAREKVRVTQTIRNFKIPRYEEGRLVWTLDCRVARILESKDISIDDPALHVTAEGTNPGYDVTAKRGFVTDDKNTIRLEEDVEMVSSQGDRFGTASLTWTVDSRTAASDADVTVHRADMRLSGKGLTANTGSRNFTIHSKAAFHRPGDKKADPPESDISIVSEGAMTFKDDVAVFSGSPTATSESGTVSSDRLELRLDTESEALKGAVATGNVRLDGETFTGRSQEARWTPGGDSVTLVTDVTLTEKKTGNTLQANRADVNPREHRLRCPGPATLVLHQTENREEE